MAPRSGSPRLPWGMSLQSALAITGPALTTVGAGLLAFDVLQGPVRLVRQQDRSDQLAEAKSERDVVALDLAQAKGTIPTGEHKAEVAANESHFARAVGTVHRDYAAALVREGARTFRLAIWGLVCVILGGIAETISAVLLTR